MNSGLLLAVAGIILFVIFIFSLFRMFKSPNKQEENRNSKLLESEKEFIKLQQKNEFLETQNRESQQAIADLKSKEKELYTENITLKTKLMESDKLKEESLRNFKEISAKILEEQGSQNNIKLDTILKPFKEDLKRYEEELQKYYKDENNQRIKLETRMEEMNKATYILHQEAQNLTQALKGSNKTIGNWGELQLYRLLDLSGLERDVDYRVEATYQSETETDTGGFKKNRFDVIIDLPNNNHIIIDAKTSLESYQQYMNSEDINDKEQYLQSFITSTKTHIKELSNKEYYKSKNVNSVSFVILFMPIESSYFTLTMKETQIHEDAWKSNVIISTSHTLMAILKSVGYLKMKDKQQANFEKIINECSSMLDKFEGFYKNFQEIEKSINKLQDTYNTAKGQLKTGRGNLISRVEKINQQSDALSKQESASILGAVDTIKNLGLESKK